MTLAVIVGNGQLYVQFVKSGLLIYLVLLLWEQCVCCFAAVL